MSISPPRLASLLALMLLPAAAVHAQDEAAATPTPPIGTKVPMWTCKMPGGTYEVVLHTITAISSHEYVVDGAARVTEVNIDTLGNSLVRFYYIEPMTPNSPIGLGQSAINKLQDYAKNGASRTGQDELWEKVVKSYPTTTHAHTVEYRVESKDDLDKIFTSVDTAFRNQQNTLYTLQQAATTDD